LCRFRSFDSLKSGGKSEIGLDFFFAKFAVVELSLRKEQKKGTLRAKQGKEENRRERNNQLTIESRKLAG
jgi:hypothetical protein